MKQLTTMSEPATNAQKLSTTIWRHIGILGAVSFAVIFVFVLTILSTSVESTISTLLKLEKESILRQLKSGAQFKPSDNLQVYKSWAKLPEFISSNSTKEIVQAEGLSIHKTSDQAGQTVYSLQYISDKDIGDIYLLSSYSEAEYERLNSTIVNDLFLNSLVISLVFSLAIWLLMSWLYYKTTLPLRELSDWAQELSNNNPVSRNHQFNILELNEIADKLLSGIASEKKYYDRETMFLKQASHELRSPLSTIQSSLEVLAAKSPEEDLNFVERALKASKRMGLLMSSLLWLARDSSSSSEKQLVSLRDHIDHLVSELDFLRHGRNLSLSQNICDSSVLIESSLLTMAMGNLIRNAFEHSAQGLIEIHCTDSHFEVFNPADPSLMEETGGFGLGLSLTQRICDKTGWTLESHCDGERYHAKIRWAFDK